MGLCTSDKTIIERLIEDYKSFKTPSETGVIVWIEVGGEVAGPLSTLIPEPGSGVGSRGEFGERDHQ